MGWLAPLMFIIQVGLFIYGFVLLYRIAAGVQRMSHALDVLVSRTPPLRDDGLSPGGGPRYPGVAG